MAFAMICDLCGDPIAADSEHYRVRLQHWSEPVGEPPAPVAPATTEVAEIHAHVHHFGDDPAEALRERLAPA